MAYYAIITTLIILGMVFVLVAVRSMNVSGAPKWWLWTWRTLGVLSLTAGIAYTLWEYQNRGFAHHSAGFPIPFAWFKQENGWTVRTFITMYGLTFLMDCCFFLEITLFPMSIAVFVRYGFWPKAANPVGTVQSRSSSQIVP